MGASRAYRTSALKQGFFSIDLVVLTLRQGRLGVLCDGEALPWGAVSGSGSMLEAARRIAAGAVGHDNLPWMEQLGAFGDGSAHPGDTVLSVAYVSVIPEQPTAASWRDLSAVVNLPERHRVMLAAAADALRDWIDRAPVAFRLLPRHFTLSELQEVYELLLGRVLHKASFRRALMAAFLVEPTNAWRREGRGRPAQLFRLSTRRRKSRRTVRFDQL